MPEKSIKIGGASGYWGDATSATAQLLKNGDLDFIVYDYLAEITMSILARAKSRNPQDGFARDFVSAVLQNNFTEIRRQKVKIIANAGGLNPEGCADAVRALADQLGLDVRIAVVTGDDLSARIEEIEKLSPVEMFSGQEFPDKDSLASINAYIGAFPIAAALDHCADIVITGRCVDSAVTLGACIHSFGWRREDWDLQASGTLAGHIIECGVQATGGNFTDWPEVSGGLAEIGYPIAEVFQDGTCRITKPPGTGGAINVGTVAEQMLYEIGDPQAYIVPDVVCDFSTVQVTQLARDCVLLRGATGYPGPAEYKISATYADGFRGGLLQTFVGVDADKKGQIFCDIVLRRSRKVLKDQGLEDFNEVSTEILGAESQYGAFRQQDNPREVIVKLAAKHPKAQGVAIMLKEATGAALAAPPGLSGFQGGRPRPSPVVRLFSFLLKKPEVPIGLILDGKPIEFFNPALPGFDPSVIFRPNPPDKPSPAEELTTVPLVRLAWARSGDKGDKANIGVIARKPEYLPYIWASLDENVVAVRFSHFLGGNVERFLLPASNAINFLLHEVLGGGGIASLRNDAQGKAYAQLLLECPVSVPVSLTKEL